MSRKHDERDPLPPDLDRILRRSIQEAAERIPLPDHEQTLSRVSGEILRIRRLRSKKRRVAQASTLAACLLLLFALNPTAQGWNPWQTITSFFVTDSGVGRLQMSSRPSTGEHAHTPPPPDHPVPEFRDASQEDIAHDAIQQTFRVSGSTPASIELRTLDDAVERSPFPLRFPSWLPEDTELLWIIYQPDDRDEKSAEVRMRIGGPAGKNLYLTQRGPVRQFAQGMSFHADETRVREVDVNGVKATLIEFQRDKSSSLDWFSEGVLTSLRSDWDGDTTLKIARSMRVVR